LQTKIGNSIAKASACLFFGGIKMKISFRLSPLLLLTLVSCGQEKKSIKGSQNSLLVSEGHYRARIIPLNRQLQKTSITGEVLSKMDPLKMNLQVDIKDLSASMIHPQYIHQGTYCPSEIDDLNSDGIIDVSEAQKAMGAEVLSLVDEEKNMLQFPKSNEQGELFYLKSFTNEQIKKNLIKSDLKSWLVQPFNLSKMSYLILGVSDDIQLPDSIKGMAGIKAQSSIPIGCGTFEKVVIQGTSVTATGDKN
jgi:hypothetical protein